MKKLFYIFLILVSFQFLSSCYTARPIAQLSSFEKDITYANGKQIIKSSSDNFTTFTVFERNETDRLVFDIEIFNTSGNTLMVDPSKFYYRYSSNKTSYQSKKIKKAYDPEKEIIKIRKKIAKGYANEKNSIAHSVTLTVAKVALATAVAAATGDEELNINFKATSNKTMKHAAINQIAEGENEYDYYNNMVLRKHTLPNGKSIRGKVFFPYDPKISNCVVHIPLQNDTMKISYIQQAISSN